MTLSENVQKVIEMSQRIVVEKSVIQTYEEIRRNTMTTELNVEERTMTSSSISSSGSGQLNPNAIHSSQTSTSAAHRVTERKFHTSSSASEIMRKSQSMAAPNTEDCTILNMTEEENVVVCLNGAEVMDEQKGKAGSANVTTKSTTKYTKEGFLEAMKNSYSLDSMLSSRATKSTDDVHAPPPVKTPTCQQIGQDFKVSVGFNSRVNCLIGPL